MLEGVDHNIPVSQLGKEAVQYYFYCEWVSHKGEHKVQITFPCAAGKNKRKMGVKTLFHFLEDH